MNEKDLIATQTIKQVSEGGDQVRADLKATAAAQDQLAASSGNLATVTETSARRQTSAAAAFNAWARSADPAARAFADLERNQATFGRALSQNSSMLDKAGQSLSVYADKLNVARAAAEALRRQQANLTTDPSAVTGSIRGTPISLNQITGSQLSGVNTSTYAAQFAAMADAADAKARQIGQQFGISLDASLIAGVAKSARDSAGVFKAELDRLDELGQQKALQAGNNFSTSLDASLIAGVGKSARDSASVFAAEMDRLDTIAQQKAAQIGKNFQDDLNKSFSIGGSSKSAAQSADVFKETIIAQEDAVTRLRTAINPLQVEQGKLGVEMANYKTLLQQGKITTAEYAAAQDIAGQRLGNFAQNLKVAGTAGRIMSGEMTNLGFQLNDIVTGLALGQSPFMILAQQGGQVVQIFANSKASIADFASASMGWFTSLFTVGRVAFGGIAAAVGAAVYAMAAFATSQREAGQALIGIGQRSGTTIGQINAFAKANASATGLSVDQARMVAVEFAKTGNIAVSGLKGVGDAVHGFAVLTGTDAAEATKTLAQAFSGSAVQAAEQLNKTYGFLSASTRDYIRTLEMQGSRTQAFQVIIDAIAKDNLKAAESTSAWAKAWDMLGNAASRVKNVVGAALVESPDSELQRLTRRRERNPDAITPREDRRITELTKNAADFSAGAIVKQFADWSLAADNVVRSTIPQIAKLEELQKAEMDLVLGRKLNDPQADAALTANRNQQTGIKESMEDVARYNVRVKEISQSWAGVSQSTALALQASQNQLPVLEAVGGAAKMMAQYAADYANALDRGKTPADALALASDNLRNAQTAANTAVKEQTFSLQNNLAVAQAWTAATQMRAQAEATARQLAHDGIRDDVAAAAAAAQYADSKARAVASAQKLVQSSQDNLDLTRAAGTADEARLKSDIAYRDAMQGGANAAQAAAISANVFAAESERAAAASQQIAENWENAARAAHDAQFTDAGGSFGDFSPKHGEQLTSGKLNAQGMANLVFPPMTAEQTANKALSSGGLNSALGAAQSFSGSTGMFGTPQPDLGIVQSLYELKNAQTNDNGLKISNLQEEMAWLQRQPETIARDQQLVSLQQSIDQLRKSTDSLNSTMKVTLNPLYTEGHSALPQIGYYRAASGIEGIVGGSGGTDSTEVRMMLTPGEHLKVTPQNQSNDNSKQITIIQNFGGGSTNTQRRNRRQAQQGYAQSIAAVG